MTFNCHIIQVFFFICSFFTYPSSGHVSEKEGLEDVGGGPYLHPRRAPSREAAFRSHAHVCRQGFDYASGGWFVCHVSCHKDIKIRQVEDRSVTPRPVLRLFVSGLSRLSRSRLSFLPTLGRSQGVSRWICLGEEGIPGMGVPGLQQMPQKRSSHHCLELM